MTSLTAKFKAYCRRRFAARHTETHSLDTVFAVCEEKFSCFKMSPGPGAFSFGLGVAGKL
jgi:hypothetical protein